MGVTVAGDVFVDALRAVACGSMDYCRCAVLRRGGMRRVGSAGWLDLLADGRAAAVDDVQSILLRAARPPNSASGGLHFRRCAVHQLPGCVVRRWRRRVLGSITSNIEAECCASVAGPAPKSGHKLCSAARRLVAAVVEVDGGLQARARASCAVGLRVSMAPCPLWSLASVLA